MDGTLIDSERIWDVVLDEYARQLGFVLTHDVRRTMLGTPMQETLEMMFDAAGTPAQRRDYRAAGKWLRDSVATVFRLGVPWRPGAQDALDLVASLQIPMVLVTNTERALTDLALETIGAGRFVTTVCIDDVAHGKPAPDPYLLAAQRVGHPIQRCLAIEDSPTGTAAAQAAGCPTLVIPSDAPVPAGNGLTFRKDLLDLGLDDIVNASARTRPASTGRSKEWRSIDLFVPAALTHRESVNYLRSHIRSIAHDAGDFIHDIRIGGSSTHSAEWHRWTATYLAGPPTGFGEPQQRPGADQSAFRQTT